MHQVASASVFSVDPSVSLYVSVFSFLFSVFCLLDVFNFVFFWCLFLYVFLESTDIDKFIMGGWLWCAFSFLGGLSGRRLSSISELWLYL